MEQNKYQRIDKGIKRSRRSVPRRRSPETGQVQAIPPDLNPKTVLEAYLTEQTTSKIAESFGVTRKSLVAWLRDVCPNEWKQVQIIRALARKEDADEGLETASDPLSLARAREMLRSGQWDLERLDSANYGQKQEVTHKVEPVFSVIVTAPQLPHGTTSITIEQPVTPQVESNT